MQHNWKNMRENKKRKKKNTDLDISWLKIDKHVVPNYNPNWRSYSKTTKSQYTTQYSHLLTDQTQCGEQGRREM
jgi:hypothetical protein